MVDISIFDIFLRTILPIKIVMLILISFSVLSWAIIIQRWRILSIVKQETKEFESKFWSNIKLSCLYHETQNHYDKLTGIEQIFHSGFKEFLNLYRIKNHTPRALVEGSSRAMHISMNHELDVLEAHIPFLGTIGSISPYIGLFGTICGIIHAFISLDGIKQTILQSIIPDIAEALIATAIGLFVAIPANIAYNYLNRYIDKLELNYNNFIEEFSAILHRRALSNNDEIEKG